MLTRHARGSRISPWLAAGTFSVHLISAARSRPRAEGNGAKYTVTTLTLRSLAITRPETDRVHVRPEPRAVDVIVTRTNTCRQRRRTNQLRWYCRTDRYVNTKGDVMLKLSNGRVANGSNRNKRQRNGYNTQRTLSPPPSSKV